MKILDYAVLSFLLGLAIAPAFAGGYGNTTNNYLTQIENITIGIDEDDFTEGLTMVAAGSSHQFDYSVQAWQASITGSFIVDESADAVSFGVGKRFDSMDVLWHGSFTRSGDTDLLVVGGTFRF